MRKLNLATLAALGGTLLAGCGMQPGESVGDDTGQIDQQVSTALLVASGSGPAIDARAAVAATGSGDPSLAGMTGWLAQWYTGALAPSAQIHYYWNNAGSAVYKVGFAPSGSLTANVCRFQVIRSWDIQQPSGEREFHFIIQNTGSSSCGANILLQSQAAGYSSSIGPISVGATLGWTWNNANPLTATHFVNVSPTGATSFNTCELEVTRSWYAQQPGGEREFRVYIKNVGTISCGGTLLLATNTSGGSSWGTGTLSPGAAVAWYWNNANPLNRVYVPGLSPLGATTTSCQLELLPTYYQEEINTDQTKERRYYIGVKNVGTISCSGTVLLNSLDPIISNPLPVNLFPQQTSQWCWAASAEMVMSYLGGMASQCEQANQLFARNDCCNSPIPAACITPGHAEWAKYGFTYDSSGALSWTDLKAQIDTQLKPFTFSWRWLDANGQLTGTGHMMVVRGYKVINGQNYVSINNPWAPNQGLQEDILYDEYVSGVDHIHGTDYYNITRL